jgi:hypothetical protein
MPATGSMIASKTVAFGIRLEGFVSPPAETVTFTFLRTGDMGTKIIWFNTHMRKQTETPAAGHGCWSGAPRNGANEYKLPTCTKNYNGPTIATAFIGNSIVDSDMVINGPYDFKIQLADPTATTGSAVQWQYGAAGTVTDAAANLPS